MQLLTKPKNFKTQGIKKTASKLTNAAISGGGTAALVGLIAKPLKPLAQRNIALAGAGIGAGMSAINSLKNRKKKNM